MDKESNHQPRKKPSDYDPDDQLIKEAGSQ